MHVSCHAGLKHLRKAPEGPTVARNLGLRRGLGDLVALVDSDVELDPGWTAATVAAMEADHRLAQVGGQLVFAHAPDVLNAYGGALGWLGLAWDDCEGASAESASAPRDVLWINSAAVLMRPEPVLAVGGFDPDFFYGYEEPDLGLRLALAGWSARVIPTAVARHHVGTRIGTSSPEIVFHAAKNRIRMGLKTLAPARLIAFIALSIAYGLADALLHRPRRARLRALGWNLVEFRATLRLRRVAQAVRVADDATVLRLLTPRFFPPRRLCGLRRRMVRGSVRADQADDRIGNAMSHP